MTFKDDFELSCAIACSPELPVAERTDQVMRIMYIARAHLHGLLTVCVNTLPDDPVHTTARDQLEALYGFLSEALGVGVGT